MWYYCCELYMCVPSAMDLFTCWCSNGCKVQSYKPDAMTMPIGAVSVVNYQSYINMVVIIHQHAMDFSY